MLGLIYLIYDKLRLEFLVLKQLLFADIFVMTIRLLPMENTLLSSDLFLILAGSLM